MPERKKITDSAAEFERHRQPNARWRFVLHLYVAGTTSHSTRAIRNLRQICSSLPKGRCELRVIDIYKAPAMARQAQVIAVPTLIRTEPKPVRKLVGDLSDRLRVVQFLDLDLITGEGAA